MERPTVLLDEQLFGLDEYLRDFGWTTTKVRPGITDDEVVDLAGAELILEQQIRLLRDPLMRQQRAALFVGARC